jgi:signal transduction histidine kinase
MIRPPDDAARRGAFASMVAHELRTPLTAAYGALEMMTREATSASAPDGRRNAVLIDLAHRNTLRLLRIVEDCLDLEAASDGRLDLERVPLEPGELVTLGVEGAGSARAQTGVRVVSRLEAGRGIVGDRARLGRAIAHLVQNAVTFAPPGTAVTVTAEDIPGCDLLRFSVEDHGPGIDPEQLVAFFQLFDCREAAGRRRIGGLGMGLAYVRMVAEQHGGIVGVTAEEGRTVVWFEVPGEMEPEG